MESNGSFVKITTLLGSAMIGRRKMRQRAANIPKLFSITLLYSSAQPIVKNTGGFWHIFPRIRPQ